METNQNVAVVHTAVAAVAAGPVMVTKVRQTKSQSAPVYQLELRQNFHAEVSNASGLLGLAMQGHDKFSKTTRTRVAWQNFSQEQFSALNIRVDAAQLDANPMGYILPEPVALNFIIGGKVAEVHIVERDSLSPRTWNDAAGVKRTQEPKRAGAGGQLLTFNGQPIYSNRELAAKAPWANVNMSFEDSIIKHNNVVTGSTTLAARASAGSAAAASAAITGPGALQQNTPPAGGGAAVSTGQPAGAAKQAAAKVGP